MKHNVNLRCAAEVLAENNRLDQLDKISDTFDDIMAAVRGEVKATITTAEVRPAAAPLLLHCHDRPVVSC